MENNRRNRLDLNSTAEQAIFAAMQEVEKAGADVRLTEVTMLLSKAKDLLADFIEGKPIEQPSAPVSAEEVLKLFRKFFNKRYEKCEEAWKIEILNIDINDFVKEYAQLSQPKVTDQKPQKEVKSAETLDLMQYVTNLLYAAANEGPTMGNPAFDNWVDEQIFHLREYESQFTQQRQVSDKDIKKWAQTTPTSNLGINWSLQDDMRYREGLEDGAFYMRDNKIKSK